jgi:hypothetical protein
MRKSIAQSAMCFCATGGSSPYHRQLDGQSSPRHLTVFWPAPTGAGPELPPDLKAAWPQVAFFYSELSSANRPDRITPAHSATAYF